MKTNVALNNYNRSPLERNLQTNNDSSIKKFSSNNNKNTNERKSETNNIFDEIVLPPNSESSENEYDAIIKPNGMNGKESFFCVPKKTNENPSVLRNYLENFCGKQVCATLWTNGKNKLEKCGILESVGTDYISIIEPNTNKLLIMTMDKVKYISVFCV